MVQIPVICSRPECQTTAGCQCQRELPLPVALPQPVLDADLIIENLRHQLGIIAPEHLALALGVTVETLVRWRGAGVGPRPTKLGKAVFYCKDDVLAWIRASGAKEPACAA
jgi:predicted DNA-binding transcriptional regulator AlpA